MPAHSEVGSLIGENVTACVRDEGVRVRGAVLVLRVLKVLMSDGQRQQKHPSLPAHWQ